MQLIAVKPLFSIVQCRYNQIRDLGLSEEKWSCAGLVQQSVHCYEGFASGQPRRRENPATWQAVVKAEGHEHRLSDDIPVRQASLVRAHHWCGGFGMEKLSEKTRRLKGGGSQNWLPHKRPSYALAAIAGSPLSDRMKRGA